MADACGVSACGPGADVKAQSHGSSDREYRSPWEGAHLSLEIADACMKRGRLRSIRADAHRAGRDRCGIAVRDCAAMPPAQVPEGRVLLLVFLPVDC